MAAGVDATIALKVVHRLSWSVPTFPPFDQLGLKPNRSVARNYGQRHEMELELELLMPFTLDYNATL